MSSTMSTKPALLHFKFDDFENLSSEVDEYVGSEVQTDCNGNKWNLRIYPGGRNFAEKEGFIALSLVNENDKSIKIKVIFTIKDEEGDIAHEEEMNEKEIAPKYLLGWGDGRGIDEFMERSRILDSNNNILKKGALAIDVTIQVMGSEDYYYQPSNEHSNNMLNLLESGKQTDITFKVGSTKIHAHSLILINNAPIFASYINQRKKKSDIMIKNTKPAVFYLILKHIYAGHIPEIKDVLKHGKELIDTANRYELVNLKMTVENILVQKRVLDKQNTADYIVFADSQSCPLLKEYAITFFLLHAKEILKSNHSKCLRESGELLSEIMMLMAGGDEEEEAMTVTELRKELCKRELDVDGSKEALVLRLKEAKRQKTE